MSYQHLVNRVKHRDYNDIPVAAQRFRDKNQSFELCIIDGNGGGIYASPGAHTSDNFKGDCYDVVHNDKALGDSVVALSMPGITNVSHGRIV